MQLPILSSTAPTSPRTVRVSFTDRCDLACVYCRPSKQDGYTDDPVGEGEFETMMRGLHASGVRRVRITGGEPLLFPRVVERVRVLARLGFEDIALTTNATRLSGLAAPLRAAGLHRLTVSLDTLRPERFTAMTRGGKLERVLHGIEVALRVGFDEPKLNTVVMRGTNDDELEALVRFAWDRGVTPRFIEVMRVGEGARLPRDVVVTRDEVRARLGDLLMDGDAVRDLDRGPARYVRARHDPRLRIGFISGTSDTYCRDCDRLRVSSDGVLRPCLATNDGVSARASAEAGSVEGVRRDVSRAWAKKPDLDTWKGCTEETAKDVSIRAIGG